MRIIEASGSPREIGLATGEALRAEIRQRLAQFFGRGPKEEQAFLRRLPVFVEVMKRELPEFLEEMEATAEGADLPFAQIAAMNFPMYANDLELPDADGCTNLAFGGGADGPIWGKNNEGNHPDQMQPPCCRLVRPRHGIPSVTITFCGTTGFAEGMNAEGLAMGHSSVGSVFQQSDRHVPIRPWAHHGLQTCRNTAEFARHVASRPVRGKGYAWVAVDRQGDACSLEIACPTTQVRRPRHPEGHIHCVNCYQLPALAEADRRPPRAKAQALERWQMLDAKLADNNPKDLESMKSLLRCHDPPGLCRHGGEDQGYTEYSAIGLPASGRVLIYHGLPCQGEYTEVSI